MKRFSEWRQDAVDPNVADENPVLYSLQHALQDFALVFVTSSILYVGIVLTGLSKSMLAWAEAYPQLDLTELFLYAIFLATGFGLISLRRWMQITDVLQREKEIEQELKERAEELKRSNEELERFAYVASHDLREPLRTVHSHLSLIERRLTQAGSDVLDKDTQDSLDFARNGAARMDRMIRGLMTYARLERSEANSVPTDMEDVLEDALGNLDVALGSSGAHVERSALPVVRCDPDEALVVMQNLIHNAIKYGGNGSEPARIVVGGSEEGDRARVWVQDDGPGVNPSQAEKIFEMFRQGGDESSPAGAGMGLTLSRRIAERHGGDLWVEQGANGGAKFVLELPRAAKVRP